jgi:hypothetical protein
MSAAGAGGAASAGRAPAPDDAVAGVDVDAHVGGGRADAAIDHPQSTRQGRTLA